MFSDSLSLGKEAWFLRYGTVEVRGNLQARLTIRCVAQLLKIKEKHCLYVLRRYQRLGQPNSTSKIDCSGDIKISKVTGKNISEAELRDLTSTDALIKLADKSLSQRVGIFNSTHPGRKLSVHHLKGLYKEQGIKRKVVKRLMKSQLSEQRQREEADRFFRQFQAAEDLHHEIVMVDECVFSQKTYQKTAWSRPGENLILSKRFSNMQCIAVVAAISNRRGLIAYYFKEKSIKQDDFVHFLSWLFKRMRTRNYTILLDQASIHRARDSSEALRGKNVLFNIPYSPWYNGIELYWALCKQVFRKSLLRAMIDKDKINLGQLTEDALESIEESKIKSCAENALKLIRRHARERNN